MKVTTTTNGLYRYALIKTRGVDMSVRIDGDSTIASLQASAAEHRAKAERLIKRAQLIEQAVQQLHEV